MYFLISSYQKSVEETSPQYYQRRAWDNVNSLVQVYNGRQLNQEYPVNAVALEMQGQDPARLAVCGNVYYQGGRPIPFGDNYDDLSSLVPRMNSFPTPPKGRP